MISLISIFEFINQRRVELKLPTFSTCYVKSRILPKILSLFGKLMVVTLTLGSLH